MIAFYVTLHYINERKYLEAVHLAKHTIQQIESCLDYSYRSESSLGAAAAQVKEKASYLESNINVSAKKLLVKAHAKQLMAEAEEEDAEKKQAVKEAIEGNASQQVKKTQSVQVHSLYDLLYD